MKTSMVIVLMGIGIGAAACTSDSGGPGDDGDDDAAALCGNGVVDDGETCDDGDNGNDFDGCLAECEAVDLLATDALVWTYVEIPGTRCIDGTASGFSINPNPDSPNLFIYLEGGGACFNEYCDSLFTWSGNTPGSGGIFDRANEANPVRDWNMVYVPYCSGDIYAGDNEVMLGGEMRYFYGYSNFTAFLQRWVPSFADADQVVLSGSSAGGFGAFTNFPQTQDAFGDVPVTLIDDSAPAMSSDVYPPCLQALFRETWGLDKTLATQCGDDCANDDDYILDYLDHVRSRYPDLRGGIFSSQQDSTIRLFAGYGWSNGYNMCGALPSQVSGAVYTQGLNDLRQHLTDGGPGFGSYYITGASHTILRSNGFYDTAIDGKSPADWVGDAVRGEPTHVGP
jgi:hypothetical protein